MWLARGAMLTMSSIMDRRRRGMLITSIAGQKKLYFE
jgi:hypothetical protein